MRLPYLQTGVRLFFVAFLLTLRGRRKSSLIFLRHEKQVSYTHKIWSSSLGKHRDAASSLILGGKETLSLSSLSFGNAKRPLFPANEMRSVLPPSPLKNQWQSILREGRKKGNNFFSSHFEGNILSLRSLRNSLFCSKINWKKVAGA